MVLNFSTLITFLLAAILLMTVWIAVMLKGHGAIITQMSGQVDTLSNTKLHSRALHTQISDMEYNISTSIDELGDDIFNLFKNRDSLNKMPKKLMR